MPTPSGFARCSTVSPLREVRPAAPAGADCAVADTGAAPGGAPAEGRVRDSRAFAGTVVRRADCSCAPRSSSFTRLPPHCIDSARLVTEPAGGRGTSGSSLPGGDGLRNLLPTGRLGAESDRFRHRRALCARRTGPYLRSNPVSGHSGFVLLASRWHSADVHAVSTLFHESSASCLLHTHASASLRSAPRL